MATADVVQPVFMKAKDIPHDLSPFDICEAITQTVHKSKLDGLQLINNVWQIYVKDKQTRLELCVKTSVVIHGKRVKLYDGDPFKGGDNNRRQLDKLTVKNLPLYVDNEEITKFLQQQGVAASSSIKYGLFRDNNGQFTSYKNGDRFVYVEPFHPPLARQQSIASLPCLLLHHGKATVCSSCGKPGHKITDDICEAKTNQNIYTFKGYLHPLSNHYPCELALYHTTFKSAEHAYLYRMAIELSNQEKAEQIRLAKHAGEAKRLSKTIASDDDRWA